jgi:leucyl aminopeptidase (aminopeptidase T)
MRKIGRVTNHLFSHFKAGRRFRVTTPKGTDFEAVIGTPFCEDGQYYGKGTGGDFPSGEIGFGPAEGSVNGTIVYDLKIQHVGILNSPLTLTVKDDQIDEIKGEHKDLFEAVCEKRGDILKYISEISLGMNPGGLLTPSSQFIPEEKNYGTLHCGHGGNASYGTRKGPHLDGVMDRPTVFLDEMLLMNDGQIANVHLDEDLHVWLHTK